MYSILLGPLALITSCWMYVVVILCSFIYGLLQIRNCECNEFAIYSEKSYLDWSPYMINEDCPIFVDGNVG